MKGKETKKEKKNDMVTNGKTKVLTEYQQGKQSKQESNLNVK